MLKILFVCSGNICRSPTAEGVARDLLAAAGLAGTVTVDSAGTLDYHVGEAPDRRAQRAAAQRGYDLSALRARALVAEDFERFDLLLAMDRGHLEIMQDRCPEPYRPRLGLFMQFAADSGLADEVPDPYHGGAEDFERVLDMCEYGVRRLLESVGTRA
ncbi:low molecular weight protein-tyrosine-phosphatase [Thauera chlorobenzoica]|uniref:protein-tyrosine-phosphatase n=1 Tax=Thauera chlorobenzoica TaxID=96773 RepID=A0A1H5RP85_9RHOO|nr:low molecular weight protein-tyrosine-phosphatase [Thauera chlorobenzoica]APR05217.1 Low molecular weight protein tyrosine phosphatase [Thauera chlorobenzoica]SEF40173.1 protein tyrosine phosphatase [Thauera chlorobenzoica]